MAGKLDANQVIKKVYDEETESLRTTATANISNISINVDIDKDEDSITAFQTTHDNFNTNANIQVNNTDVGVSNPVPVNIGNFPATQPVSVVSLPLPSGAATSANQIAIDKKINNLSNYIFHNSDESAGTTYIGTITVDNKYLIKKVVESGSAVSILYANISNNSLKTDYSTAWTDRATLSYDLLYNLTGI